MWVVLVGVVAPVVLGYILVSRIVHVATEGYSGMPTWYLLALGWGSVAFAVLAAVLMTFVPWKSDPDRFVAWPPIRNGEVVAVPAGAGSDEEVAR